MRHYSTIALCLLTIVFNFSVQGQQLGLQTLYNQNNYMINPAAAGLDNCFSAYINHRNQWVGINNSPTTNMLTIDGRLGTAHGIGLDARMSNAGLLKNLNAKLSYAYHLKIGTNSFLHAGASLGFIQQQFRANDAIASDYSDELLLQGNQSDMGFTSDIGILFTVPRFKFGVSVPQVFSSGLNIDYQAGKNEFELVQHMSVYAQYDVVNNDNWVVAPSVLYRNSDFNGHQLDLGAEAMWNNIVGAGFMYRTAYGMSGILSLNIQDKFKLGYAYEFGGSKTLTQVSRGSHEIMLGIKLCKSAENKPLEFVPEPDTSSVVDIPKVDSIPQIDPIEIDSVVDTPLPEPDPWIIDLDSLNTAFSAEDRLIRYDLNSAQKVTSNNQKTVTTSVAKILKDHPDLKVTVVGHACGLGTAEFNQMISEKRAKDVANEIKQMGIEASRLQHEGKGESQPLLQNNSEYNRQKNRRVQIIFTK